MPFSITQCSIEGLFEIQPKVFGDSRGYFSESWNAERAPCPREIKCHQTNLVSPQSGWKRRAMCGGAQLSTVSFSLTDFDLIRQHVAEVDRQILEALTADAPVAPADMDL